MYNVLFNEWFNASLLILQVDLPFKSQYAMAEG